MRYTLLSIALLILAGCGSDSPKPEVATPTTPAASKPAPVDPKLLVVSGPGGDVAIGDPVEKAKKAFPPPKGVQAVDSPVMMSGIGAEGWGWTTNDSSPDVVEVVTEGGKIIAIAGPTEKPKDFDADAKAVVAKLGKPLREGVGKVALLYVWESGENAHLYMQVKQDMGPFGKLGVGHIVGPKDKLKALFLDADNPQAFVNLVDQSAEAFAKANPAK